MLYEIEFPDFVLDVAIPEGFDDSSYHNDVCPSFLNIPRRLQLYIDFADNNLREIPEMGRFCLIRTDEDGCATDDMPLLETDDYNEITAYLNKPYINTTRVIAEFKNREGLV